MVASPVSMNMKRTAKSMFLPTLNKMILPGKRLRATTMKTRLMTRRSKISKVCTFVWNRTLNDFAVPLARGSRGLRDEHKRD